MLIYSRENDLLNEENTLAINAYHGDLETVNPLGPSGKKPKICALYWVLGNLPPKFQSTLKVIQLAIFGRTEDIKHFGLEKVLSCFLSDMKVLEEVGVIVESLVLACGGIFAYVSADSLAAALGGFNELFGPNVLRICRFIPKCVENVH